VALFHESRLILKSTAVQTGSLRTDDRKLFETSFPPPP
jgi:hypothetical protein